MKNDRTLNVMEHIDPDIIVEAESYTAKKKSNLWIKWGTLAACLCICLVGAAKLNPTMRNSDMDTDKGYGIEDYDGTVQGGNDHFAAKEAKGDECDDIGSESDTHMMISHYDKSLNGEDMAVNNGHYELSNSLKAALSEYGNTVSYRVIVEVFKDGKIIDSGSSEVNFEMERLAGEKYIVAHETYEDTAEKIEYFTIHAEEDQLLHFSVNEAYGYFISLYDEYLGMEEQMDQAVDETNSNFIQATEYPADILEMQAAISDAMAHGKLPYVSASCIYEEPLRIEVFVNTTDKKQIEELKSSFDPSGQYIVVVQGERAAWD